MERIYKKDWEDYDVNSHILGVEMQNGNKYYLLPNVDGAVPVNLKIHDQIEYCDYTDIENIVDVCSNLNGNKKVFIFDNMSEMISWATL